MTKRRKFLKSAAMTVAAAGLFSRQTVTAKTTGKGALLHDVYFWLKNDVSDKQRKAFEKGLKNFVKSVKEIQKAEIGKPAPTARRDVVDHSFDYSLLIRFKSMEDHNTYQEHEAHKKFIEDFSKLWAKVQVYDSSLL